MTYLHLYHISKSFDHTLVLDHIYLDIKKGEFVCILGQSGSGKTTLLRLIAGFEKVDCGEISLDGRTLACSLKHIPPEQRDIGIVFQDHALWPHLSVYENIAFPLAIKKLPTSIIQSHVASALRDVAMDGFEKRFPHQLSGGEAQRVALARTLVQNPQLIIFDEPLASLDALLRYELQAVIKKIHYDKGITSLYITHDQLEAMRLSDRIAILEKGVIQQYDTPENLYHHPKTETVAKLLGQGVCLHGDIVAIRSDTIDIHLKNRPHSIFKITCHSPGLKIGSARFFIRPEHVTLSTSEISPFSLSPPLACTVMECFFIAGYYVIDLCVLDSDIYLKAKHCTPLSKGETIFATLHHGSVMCH